MEPIVCVTSYMSYTFSRICDGPACENFIPAGLYGKKARILTCSPKCADWRRWKGTHTLTCDCGCGLHFLGSKGKNNVSGLVFISQQHRAHYITAKYQSESCGPFLGLVVEYLNGFASRHYRDIRTPRVALCPFFHFLNTIGIRSVGEASPRARRICQASSSSSSPRGRGTRHVATGQQLRAIYR
jgi:hypothetical protein